MVLSIVELDHLKTIRILLVEDEAFMCEFLLQCFQQEADIDCIAAAVSLSEARAVLRRAQPDVLVTDLQLPDGSGMDLIRQVRQESPNTEILVISVLCDPENVVKAIRAGASGYILKDSSPNDFVEAVRDVASGRSAISASVARHIVRQMQAHDAHDPEQRPILTPREIDILYAVAKGLIYDDIAEQFGLSSHTVASHIKSIYRKLEVNSRSEAVFEAVSRKIIRL